MRLLRWPVVMVAMFFGCSAPVEDSGLAQAPPPGDSADTGAVAPLPLVGPPPVSTTPGNLRAIFQESGVCFLARGFSGTAFVDVLGLDSATVAPLVASPVAASVRHVTSVFLDHGDLILSTEEATGTRLISLNPRTGAMRRAAAISWGAVHKMGPGYLLEDQHRSSVYGRLSALIAGQGAQAALPPRATTRGNGATWLPGTWSFASEVEMIDPATLHTLRTVPLQGFDAYVQDVQEAGPFLYVMDAGQTGVGPLPSQVLWAFDPAGSYLKAWMLTTRPPHYDSFYCTPTP